MSSFKPGDTNRVLKKLVQLLKLQVCVVFETTATKPQTLMAAAFQKCCRSQPRSPNVITQQLIQCA
eukprot:2506237-Amphidinium_carterae.1